MITNIDLNKYKQSRSRAGFLVSSKNVHWTPLIQLIKQQKMLCIRDTPGFLQIQVMTNIANTFFTTKAAY